MQEDPETLLALQRANIVAQYHQACQAGSPQDLSLWKVTNHQGFLQDKQLPGPSPHEAKKHLQETQHANKWIKMLNSRETQLWQVYKGAPPQVRGQVWLRLLNINKVKARNPGKYQEMKEEALVSSQDITQIDLDINRMFHSHTMFWDCYGAASLFHMLSAYSVYNTEVGYCQGMSKIVAILLTFLPEEDAFWALAQLMTDDRHAMHGFLIPGFPKLLRFQAHHEHILDRALPKLKKHIGHGVGPEHLLPFRQGEEQMCTGIYTPKWFLQCFIDRTPFSLTLKLWDAYILDGECMLTAMAYTILRVHRKRLLKLPLEGLREFLQDSLAQPWALEEKVVLRHLRTSMTQLRRMKCDLPSPGGGSLGGSAVRRLPLAQGVILESRDRVLRRAPSMEPASVSSSLSLSHEWINKILKKKNNPKGNWQARLHGCKGPWAPSNTRGLPEELGISAWAGYPTPSWSSLSVPTHC
ncbi:unnamed protein product [Nyctereutes procyonoides]|uniref:(raccoon dog) hypothetical protein n=1 Tax=Nyctereutes procyonoides TaxID=34880 RepID=A0A811YMM1_NYCPR|nr:unnamed protein product [Nyctereutes procyonoides]